MFSGVWAGGVFENIQPLDISVGGNRVAIGRGAELLVWDNSTGQQISRLGGFSGRLMGISVDGSRVFEQGGGVLRVRDAATLQVSRTVNLNDEELLQVSQDGSRYLTRSSGNLAVRDLADGALVRSLNTTSFDVQLSPGGRYLLTTQYQTGQPTYILWNLATGGSAALPLPPTTPNPSAPQPQVRPLKFSLSDERLAGVFVDSGQNRQLLVWNLGSNTLEAALQLPAEVSGVRNISMAADGRSGDLFVQSFGGGLRYLSLPWTLQAVGQVRDVTPLFSAFFRKGISPIEEVALVAGETYLLSYIELELATDAPTVGPPVVKAAGLARVGSAAWDYRREAAAQPLRLEVQAQYVSASEYSITGAATLAGQNYTVSGRGGGGGVQFFGVKTQSSPPPGLTISLELTGPSGQKSQLSASQFVSSGQSTAPPRYTGTLSGSNGPGLRVELQRP